MLFKTITRSLLLSLIIFTSFLLGELIIDFIDIKITPAPTNLNIAIRHFDEEYNNNYEAIIADIYKEMNANESSYDSAIHQTLLMHYSYLIQDYDFVIDHFEEVSKLLESNNLQVELLHLYSIISSIYLTQERYELSYAYTQRADTLIKELLKDPRLPKQIRDEYESTLGAIKYMKVSILIRLELFDLAHDYFEEAEAYREEADIRERADIYFNIINYYAVQNNYEMVLEYYHKLLALDGEQINSKKANATIYLAQLQLKNGDIPHAIESIQYVSEYQGNSAIVKSNIYDIHSLIYQHYGENEDALLALKSAYEVIKDTPYNLKHKLTIVDKIITLSEEMGEDPEVWYKVYREIDQSTIDTKSVQLMLGQLLDLELSATKEKQVAMKLEFLNIILIFMVIIVLLTAIITQITRKNYEDGLTKISNRKLFNIVYQRLLSRKQEFYIMMLDIDNFKHINDTYGHEFGDKVLVDLSRKLRQVLPKHCYLYRYGGEEFVIVVRKRTKDEVFTLSEQFRKTIEAMTWDNIDNITVSIGCASYKTHQQDVLSKADEYLYISKKTGKNKSTI